MANPGMFGFDRREETGDPNAQHNIPPAAQVAVGGVQAPRPVNTQYVSQSAQELAAALGEVGGAVSETFAQQREKWRLDGQLQAAQGKTQEQIKQAGNFYTLQGAQMYDAQTALQEFQQEALSQIENKDHEIDPTTYRENLSAKFAAVSDKLGSNSFIRAFASEQAASILPRIITAQTAAHNTFAQKKLKDAYTLNLTTSSGAIDPNNPHEGQAELEEKYEPGFSGLSESDEKDAWVASAVLALSQGRTQNYDALGGPEGWKARGLDANQVSQLQNAYSAYNQQRKVDFANEFSDAQANIVSKASINPDPVAAGKEAQALIDLSRKNPSWAGYVAAQTNAAAISAILDQRNPLDNPAQSNIRTQNIMQPEIFKRIGDAYSAIQQGTLKGDQETGVVMEIAKAAGVSEQDIYGAFDAFKQTDNRLAIDTVAKVKGKVQSALDANTKLMTGAQAFATETLAQLSSGDQADAIAAQWQIEIGKAEAAGQPGVQTAEARIIPALARMDIVDPAYSKTLTAAFNGAKLENGKIDANTVMAYDTLIRMKGYGLSDYQLMQYLGGENSHAAKLWAQANDFDLGDMDTASALTSAKLLLDRKVDVSMFSEKVEKERIEDLATELVSDKAGWLTRWESYGLRGIFTSDVYQEELERAAKDPSFLGELQKRSEIFKVHNPTMTAEAASRMAKNSIAGRTTYVAGQLIIGGKNSSVPQDMGLSDENPMAPNMAVMLWMRDHGPTAFGAAFNEFKVVGDDPEKSWVGNWTYGMIGQLSDSIDKSVRGAPQFKTWYDADRKNFVFSLYADQTENAPLSSTVIVPAKEIGGYFQAQMKKKGLDDSKFWDDVGTKWFNTGIKQDPIPMPTNVGENPTLLK